MTLRCLLDSLDGLPDDVAKEYEEKDGKFILILDDDIRQHPKAKAVANAFERARAREKELKDKLAEVESKLAEYPEDFNAEQFASDMDELTTLRAKKKKGGDDPDPEQARQKQLYEQRIATLERKHGEDKAALEKEKAELIKEIERLVADEGLRKELIEAGVEKKLMNGAIALHRKNVKVRQDETTKEWSGYFETDLGETSIKDFIGNWAQSDDGQIYIAKAKGGGGNGSGEQMSADNPFSSKDGKKPNLTKQQELIAKNPERARQLATQAGVTPNW